VQVYIYVTRSDHSGSTTGGGIVIHHLKPPVAAVIETSVERCRAIMATGKRPSGIYIGVCGVSQIQSEGACSADDPAKGSGARYHEGGQRHGLVHQATSRWD
jgi:hypothetical protein